MLDDAGWRRLCQRLASETNSKKRLALLAQLERAAREEQEFIKLQLQPHLQRYGRIMYPSHAPDNPFFAKKAS
jgi:hypothetical protein